MASTSNTLNHNIFEGPKYRELYLQFHNMYMGNLKIQTEYYISTTWELIQITTKNEPNVFIEECFLEHNFENYRKYIILIIVLNILITIFYPIKTLILLSKNIARFFLTYKIGHYSQKKHKGKVMNTSLCLIAYRVIIL